MFLKEHYCKTAFVFLEEQTATRFLEQGPDCAIRIAGLALFGGPLGTHQKTGPIIASYCAGFASSAGFSKIFGSIVGFSSIFLNSAVLVIWPFCLL
jgi:hypothetical protein